MDPCNTVKIESEEKAYWKNHEIRWPFPISPRGGGLSRVPGGGKVPFCCGFLRSL